MAKKKGARTFGTAERLASGKFRARFTGPDGRRYKAAETFARAGSAEVWLDRMERSISEALADGRPWTFPDAPKAETAKPLTFGEYAQTVIDSRELKPRTRQDYQGYLDDYLVPVFGKRLLTEITAREVATWHAGFLKDQARDHAAGKTRRGDGKTLRAHVYQFGRSVMRDAERQGLIDRSPFTVPRGGAVKRPATAVLPEVIDIQLAAEYMRTGLGWETDPDAPAPYRLAVFLAAALGLRAGEVCALQRQDVNLKDATLTVQRNLSRLRAESGGLTIVPPKTTAGYRVVPIPEWLVPRVAEHLDRYVRRRPSAWLFDGTEGPWQELQPDGRMVTHEGLRPVTEITLNRHWTKAREKAGIPSVRFHGLRHFAASYAIVYGGATDREAMRMLGQESPGILNRYVDEVKGRGREIVEAMPALDGTPTGA
jgi:integrase